MKITKLSPRKYLAESQHGSTVGNSMFKVFCEQLEMMFWRAKGQKHANTYYDGTIYNPNE